jgi:hypothetical protein
MQVSGNVTSKNFNVAEGANSTATQTNTEQPLNDTLIAAIKNEPIVQQEILTRSVRELNQAITDKQSTKVQSLIDAIKKIAPDVAKAAVLIWANPLKALGIAIEKLLE